MESFCIVVVIIYYITTVSVIHIQVWNIILLYQAKFCLWMIQIQVYKFYRSTTSSTLLLQSLQTLLALHQIPGFADVEINTCHCSVAEVLFRTAPENQNRQNWTVKFGSVLFSPRNSWSCSVLGSYIWEDIQNRVWTGLNRTSSDIILCFQTEAVVCLSECHLFFLFLFGQHGNRQTTLKPW